MALEKGFLRDPEVRFNGYLIFSGILLSLMVSTVVYFLFTYFQEAYRVFPFESKKTLLILTPYEINFYNLFYAALASIIGQNFGQKLILQNSRPIRKHKTRLSQKLILNGTEFTLWTTFYWIVKTFSLLGILYWTFVIHYDISFIEELAIFLILLPIVWFLNSQLGLYRILRKMTFKWIGVAILLFLMSTTILSRINIWDHETINHKILSETLEYKYHLSIPKAKNFSIPRQYRQSIRLSMVRSKTDNGGLVLFAKSRHIHLQQITLSDIRSIIQRRGQKDLFGHHVVISADSEIDLHNILVLEDTLRLLNIPVIGYQVTPENSRYPQVYPPFSHLSQSKWIGHQCRTAKTKVDSLRNLGYKAKQIKWPEEHFCYYISDILDENRVLVEMRGGQLSLNNQVLEHSQIRQTISTLFKKYESDLTILFKPDSKSSFAQYIRARDLLFQAIIDLRKEYALNEFGFEYHYDSQYNFSHDAERRLIHQKYPLSIVELTGWNLEFYEFLRSN